MGKLFCIADIHGRRDLLDKLMLDLTASGKLDLTVDKLVFTGDLIDRGDDSCGVIEKVKSLTETYPDNVVVLLGNHEAMALMYYAGNKRWGDADLWFSNGGRETVESYSKLGLSDMSNDHLVWLSKLPMKYETQGFFFSHAPVPRESYRNIVNRGLDFTPDELLWTYHSDEKGVARDHGNGIIGVSGHIHQLKKGVMAPRFYDNHYYLDTGCGCSPKAPLCAVDLDTKEVVYAWP